MAPNEYKPLIDKCKQMFSDGKTTADILKYLREETNSKATSIIVIVDVLNVSASEAKILVHRSEIWDDVRERDEQLHEIFYGELKKVSNKNKQQ